MSIECIRPDWPAADRVRACTTTRGGGVSVAPWHSMNLAAHVGDTQRAVAENRRRLGDQLCLPDAPRWLEQVHGTRVCEDGDADVCADASYSERPGSVCAVLTADCLPVLLCDAAGTAVAAAHAGWRGLLAGVLEQAVAAFGSSRTGLMAWMGPAIGPTAFEVGDEVRAAFVAADPLSGECFTAGREDRWLADLYALARRRLLRAGVSGVYGGGLCTYNDAARFYSYRRDGTSGRMASLIWLQP